MNITMEETNELFLKESYELYEHNCGLFKKITDTDDKYLWAMKQHINNGSVLSGIFIFYFISILM